MKLCVQFIKRKRLSLNAFGESEAAHCERETIVSLVECEGIVRTRFTAASIMALERQLVWQLGLGARCAGLYPGALCRTVSVADRARRYIDSTLLSRYS